MILTFALFRVLKIGWVSLADIRQKDVMLAGILAHSSTLDSFKK
ncbi:hypothetical protein LJR153_001385 [Paenibacillus sp. LjRoot153]